jgi:ribonuclease-3
MEEMPTTAVPDTAEPRTDFIVDSAPHPMPHAKNKAQKVERLERFDGTDPEETKGNGKPKGKVKNVKKEEVDEFDLSDIKTGEPSREDIIAAAEAAAFGV